METNKYILKKLDNWYSDKIEKYYTKELETEVLNLINKELIKDIKLNIFFTIGDVRNKLKRESQIEDSKEYFSKAFYTMENIIKNEIKEMDKGIKEEYLDPMLKARSKLSDFINNVIKLHKKKHMEDITNFDIDKVFIDIFNNHEGLTDFHNNYLKSIPYSLNLLVMIGDMSQEKYDKMIKSIDILSKPIPYINKQIFGNIK